MTLDECREYLPDSWTELIQRNPAERPLSNGQTAYAAYFFARFDPEHKFPARDRAVLVG